MSIHANTIASALGVTRSTVYNSGLNKLVETMDDITAISSYKQTTNHWPKKRSDIMKFSTTDTTTTTNGNNITTSFADATSLFAAATNTDTDTVVVDVDTLARVAALAVRAITNEYLN